LKFDDNWPFLKKQILKSSKIVKKIAKIFRILTKKIDQKI